MATENKKTLKGHELVQLSVASGTQLSARAADVAKNLSKNNPAVVCLCTRSRSANKLISIVEITKRELKSKGVTVFQYNAMSSETIQIERKQSNGAAQAIGDAEYDSDDAFETMGTKTADGLKQRVIPVMTTYLSVSSIADLKTRYGEQR